jgi:hypothetical protein
MSQYTDDALRDLLIALRALIEEATAFVKEERSRHPKPDQA